jgi:hypothetical protein
MTRCDHCGVQEVRYHSCLMGRIHLWRASYTIFRD